MTLCLSLVIAFSLSLAHASDALADTKFNPYTGNWELADPDDELTYNAYEGNWSYAPDSASPKYNPFENKWELGTGRSE
jgi:hypothetical protein